MNDKKIGNKGHAFINSILRIFTEKSRSKIPPQPREGGWESFQQLFWSYLKIG